MTSHPPARFRRRPHRPRPGCRPKVGELLGPSRSGAPVTAVACHGTMTRKGRAFFRPHRPVIMVALGDPLQLPAGPAARRTVAAAADEIHRALAAHIAATHPAPRTGERTAMTVAEDTEDVLDLPVLAVVGRPNVGKSTLVNRILGRREAVVQDVPGSDPGPGRVRRAVVGSPVHRGRHRRLGAGRAGARGPGRRPGRAGACAPPTPSCWSSTPASARPRPTRPSARVLRRGGKPVVLAANKVDDERTEPEAAVAVVARAGGAAPGQRAARPRRRRPARRDPRRRCPSARRSGTTPSAARAGSPWSAGRTSASPACSTG